MTGTDFDKYALPIEDTRHTEKQEQLLQQQKPVNQFHLFTKSDTDDETTLVRGIHVNTNGNIKCLLENDTEPTIIVVLAGSCYPYRMKRVYSTGTTADIVGIL